MYTEQEICASRVPELKKQVLGITKKGQASQKKRKWRHGKGFLPLIFPTLGHLEHATWQHPSPPRPPPPLVTCVFGVSGVYRAGK